MASYRRDEIWTGAFVLAAFAVFALFAFRIGGWDPLGVFGGPAGRRFTLELPEARGIGPGARVAVGGVTVGRVAAVELAAATAAAGGRGDSVVVAFDVTDPALRIDPAGASAGVVQEGVLGPFALDLHTGDPARATLEHAGPVRIAGRSASGAGDVMSAAEDAVATVQAVASSLAETVPVLRTLLQNVTDLTDPSNAQGLQRQLVEPGAGVLKRADQLLADVGRALDPATLERVRRVAAEAERLLQRAQASLAELDAATASARALVDENRAGVGRAVAGAEQTTAALRDGFAALQGDARALLQLGHAVVSENRAEVAEILRRLRRSAWQAELALRQVRGDPASLLWGGGGLRFEAELPGAAELGDLGRAPLYEQRDEAERKP